MCNNITNTNPGDLLKPRYFICQSEEDRKCNTYKPTCKILDRHKLEPYRHETLNKVFHRYVVVEQNLYYLDAFVKVKQLNQENNS